MDVQLGNFNKNVAKCNHRPEVKTSSLEFIELANMVYPPRYYAVCPLCGASFEFVKNEKGKLVKFKNDN